MVQWLDGTMDQWYNGMMRVASVYGEEVIVSSEAPERRGEEQRGEEMSGEERTTNEDGGR